MRIQFNVPPHAIPPTTLELDWIPSIGEFVDGISGHRWLVTGVTHMLDVDQPASEPDVIVELS